MRSSAPLLGSTTPRIWTRPLVTGPPGPCGCGCALTPATSLGYSAVDFAEQVIGITLIPWQRWLLIHALELLPTGAFRYRTILILVARQNGKTTLVEVKNLWKMFVLGVPLIIGTAQILDYAEESWSKAVEIVEGIPDLAAEITHVDKTNGKKALKLANGSRWKIAAASRRGGRSLSADDVNLDELREHQNWESWGAVTKTTMARPRAQIYAFSNAGDDKSVVLNDLQPKGRAAAENPEGADPTFGHFEWSAPDDIDCDCGRPSGVHRTNCALQDRQMWTQPNPSLGYGITEQAIASALATDPVEVFRTEVLCQRVEDLAGKWLVIGAQDWADGLDGDSEIVGPIVVAAQVALDRSMSAIAAAGRRADGALHVEITSTPLRVDHRPGTGWVPARLAHLAGDDTVVRVVMDEFGATGSLIPAAEAAGLEVTRVTAADVGRAYGMFYDAVSGEDTEARCLHHIGQSELTAAAAAAVSRRVGQRSAWDMAASSGDITPLVAATNALWGYLTRPTDEAPEAWAAWM